MTFYFKSNSQFRNNDILEITTLVNNDCLAKIWRKKMVCSELDLGLDVCKLVMLMMLYPS